MSKDKKQLPYKNNDEKELDFNGDPIDPKREYIGNKVKVPMVSPNSSIYKTSSTIIIRGRVEKTEDKKKEKFLEFLSRAPVSFNDNED